MIDSCKLEPLNRAQIEPALIDAGLSVELHEQLDSTNSALARSNHRHRHVVLAELQTAGRGRRGRAWLSPPYSGLCMSLAYQFQCRVNWLGPLSLALGIAAAETVREQTGLAITIKWPNDLMRDDRKLGGLLIELQPDTVGYTNAVIGLGLNVQLPDEVFQTEAALADAASGRGWADLQVADRATPSRTQLVITLAIALDRACYEYAEQGFEAFAGRWAVLDSLAGTRVQAIQSDGTIIEGVASGLRADGALWVETDYGRVALNAAEISVRGA